jgi:hypothetical protein
MEGEAQNEPRGGFDPAERLSGFFVYGLRAELSRRMIAPSLWFINLNEPSNPHRLSETKFAQIKVCLR